MKLLLDTNIISVFLKPNDTRGALYGPLIQGHHLYISFMTLAELYRWALVREWGPLESPDWRSTSNATRCSPSRLSYVRSGPGSRRIVSVQADRSPHRMPGSRRLRCTTTWVS